VANEAIIVELLGNRGDPIQLNCADGDAFPKGTILKLSNGRQADLSSADGELCAGICAAEKVANDGSTTVTAYTNGIFILKEADSAQIDVGSPVTIGGANTIKLAAAGEAESGDILGRAMETIAKDGTGEVRVLL